MPEAKVGQAVHLSPDTEGKMTVLPSSHPPGENVVSRRHESPSCIKVIVDDGDVMWRETDLSASK